MTEHPIAAWHRLVKERNPRGLDALLDADAVFHSPVMHRRIIEFKVMLRPLKAINLVHQRMAALLQAKP